MKRKLIYTIAALALLTLSFLLLWPKTKPQPVALKQASFTQLPGWKSTKVKKSLTAFQVSCKTFLRQNPEQAVGSQHMALQAKDWHPACLAALKVDPQSEAAAREFFQTWFTPVEFFDKKPVQGLFTGYYMPLLHGSLTKTKKYNVPLYGLPSNMVTVNLADFDPALKGRRVVGRLSGNKLQPFYTRQQINNGAIANKAPVLVWVDNRIDRLFLEIQGSGTIELEDGQRIFVGYAGENGAPYTAIAKVLMDKGVMTKHNASMQHIRSYLDAHPEQMDAVLHQNKSFVFFRRLKDDAAQGAQGVSLTPGYSLAVDRKWIPLGVPLWLNTTRPDQQADDKKVFQRLMIAQDTGGAIRGQVRGDVYWGAGEKATFIAGHMKNPGHYWLLLPRHALSRLQKEFA